MMSDSNTPLLGFLLTHPLADAFDVLVDKLLPLFLELGFSVSSFLSLSFSTARGNCSGHVGKYLSEAGFSHHKLVRPKFVQQIMEFIVAMSHHEPPDACRC